MNQSSFIAAFLLAGFVLWLAANNRLSAYAAVLWGNPEPATSGSSTVSNSPLGSVGDAIGNWLTQNTGASSTETSPSTATSNSGPTWSVTPMGPGADGTTTTLPSPGANPISSIGNTVSSAIGSVDALSTIAGFFGL